MISYPPWILGSTTTIPSMKAGNENRKVEWGLTRCPTMLAPAHPPIERGYCRLHSIAYIVARIDGTGQFPVAIWGPPFRRIEDLVSERVKRPPAI
ncbi:hypothetical protein N7485_013294 [Penicillium canescens]|nr:hypothetical protein N7485_013294 [Penicillium canescens]